MASAVDSYISDRLLGPDAVLEEALKANAEAGLPAIDVSPPQGKLLCLLARAIGAKRILEFGTLGGYSTIWLARGLPEDGQLISLEANPAYAEVAQANVARAGLDDVVEVRVGAALETLPQVETDGLGPFDLIFIDADKRNQANYLRWALRLSRPGTVIVGDNVVREGAVLDPESDDPSVQGIREFYDLIATEPRLDATAIQTVGTKGHDGFALAVVS